MNSFNLPKQLTEKRGITLLLAIVVVSLLLSAGLNLMFIATKELGFSRLSSDSVKAHYAAESVLECAVHWMFKDDGIDYFKTGVPAGTYEIFCNNETIPIHMQNTGSGYEAPIPLGIGTDQYAEVIVTRSEPYDKKNFTLEAEGFNDDGTLANTGLVQQEIGAVSIESCSFEPGAVVPGSVDLSTLANSELQDTLDTAFGVGVIDANANERLETWKLDVDAGATVIMEALFLSSEAGHTNTFGYYTQDASLPYGTTEAIYDDNGFGPAFANKAPNHWSAPVISENDEPSTNWDPSDWKTFNISIGPGDAIAFAIDTQAGSLRTSTNFDLRTTENALNEVSGSSNQWVLGYSLPMFLWEDSEVPEYVLAFEDESLASSKTTDYDDMVVVMRVKSCVNQFQRY